MADLLNLGTRALTSFQTAISTTGNNIANANTEGYSRQRINLAAQDGQSQGSFHVGNGVTIAGIQRVYNDVLRTELLTRSSSQASMQAFYELSTQLEGLFSEPQYGVQGSIDAYQSALSDVVNNPSSLPERQVLIAEAQNLVSRFTSMGDYLEQIEDSVQLRIENDIETINDLSNRIAELNHIIDSNSSTDVEPSELLDRRELLLRELSEKIDIRTINQQNGVIAVYMSNGTALVNGLHRIELRSNLDEFGSGIEINQQGVSGGISQSALTTGGSLGGLLQFQADVLKPAMQEFGLMSISLTEAVNTQQRLGLDLNDNPGIDFFQATSIQAKQSIHNTGSANVSVALVDFSLLEPSDYELEYDGANWTLNNLQTGSSQTGASPLSLDGLEITITGSANAGDRFSIQPSIGAVGELDLSLTEPSSIAAASALRTASSLSNAGSSSVSNIQVNDLSTLPLAADIQLTFDPDALGVGVPGFMVTGIAGGPLAFDPTTDANGVTYMLAGFDFEISGTPVTGDTHSIANNFGATGDGSNALALADLLDSKLLANGNSLTDMNASLLGFIGAKTAGVESSLSIENTLLNSAEQAVEAVSGVNLDEEAADLLRYQQAYQASAQIINVADELFQTLLNATS